MPDSCGTRSRDESVLVNKDPRATFRCGLRTQINDADRGRRILIFGDTHKTASAAESRPVCFAASAGGLRSFSCCCAQALRGQVHELSI